MKDLVEMTYKEPEDLEYDSDIHVAQKAATVAIIFTN